MKLRPRDLFLSIIMLTIASGASWLLFQDLIQAGLNSGTPQVGRVATLSNSLERRYLNDTRWIKVGKGDSLYQFDSIRTGVDSEGEIKIDFTPSDGKPFKTTLNLQENTFITLSFTQNATVDIEEGVVSKQLNEDEAGVAQSFVFRIGDQLVDADGAVDISRSASGETGIVVKEGTVGVSSNGVSETLGKNESANLQQGSASIRKKEMLVVPKNPAQGQFYLTFESLKSLQFQWDVIKLPEALSLELSSDKNFDESRQFDVTRRSRYDLELPSGRYFWRLAAPVEDEIEYSSVSSFTVVKENSIIPISPQDGKNFTYRNKEPIIQFNCSNSVNADRYRLEIAQDRDFQQVIYSNDKLRTPNFKFDQLESGNWFWRVTPYYEMNGIGYGDSTTINSFSIVQRETLSPPRMKSPLANQSFMKGIPSAEEGSALAGDKSVRFSWAKDPEIQEFLLTVWNDNSSYANPVFQFQQNLNTKSINVNEFESEGVYSWQVDGFGANQSIIPGAQTRPFKINKFEVKLAPFYPGNNESITLNDNNQIAFQWNSNLNKNFTIDIFKDNKNPPAIYNLEGLSEKSKLLTIQTEGTYFWQVSYNDSVQQKKSEIYQFQVFTPLNKPAIISPIPSQNVTIVEDEGLTFRWRVIANAESYQADLYQEGFDKPFMSKSDISDSFWKVDDISSFQKGNYRLNLRASAKGIDAGTLRYSPLSSVDFKISSVLIYNPAQLISPNNRSKISLDIIKESGLAFKWNQRPQMDYFYLDISSTADFRKIEQSIYSDVSTAAINYIDPGEYYWRVRSFDPDDRDAPVSQTYSFTVEPSTRKFPPLLDLPRNKAPFSVKQEKAGLQFSWNGNEKYKSWRFQLASDTGFKKLVINEQVFGKRISVRGQLTLGDWYWRVGAIRDDGSIDIFSEVRRFSIDELQGKIAPVYPTPNMELETDPYGSLNFQWASDFQGPFRFQLYNERRPTIPITVLNTDENKLRTMLPGSGSYYWQVLFVDKTGTVFKTGDKYLFTAYRPLSSPEIISPLPNSEYLFKKEKTINFMWEEVPEADFYDFTIINADQDSIIVEEEVPGINYTLNKIDKLPVGSYQIKINAAAKNVSGEKRVSGINSMGFNIIRPVEGLIPELKSPANKTLFERLKILENGIDFSWGVTEPGAFYWLEIATDSSFREIYRYRKVDEVNSQFDDFDAGNYYWRVRVENPVDGSQLNSKLNSFQVLPLPVLDNPILTIPGTGTTVYMDYADSLDFNWTDVKKAEYYIISCFSANGDIVFEGIQTSESQYKFTKLEKLDIGQFYCIIKAVGYAGIQKITIESLEQRFDFEIGFESEIETPDILSPEIQYAE